MKTQLVWGLFFFFFGIIMFNEKKREFTFEYSWAIIDMTMVHFAGDFFRLNFPREKILRWEKIKIIWNSLFFITYFTKIFVFIRYGNKFRCFWHKKFRKVFFTHFILLMEPNHTFDGVLCELVSLSLKFLESSLSAKVIQSVDSNLNWH